MHHSKPVRLALWNSMLGLLLGGVALAQPPAPPAPPTAARGAGLIVPIGTSKPIQMSTKRNIARVDNPKPNVVRVQAVVDDPKSVLVTGLEAGVTQITLTDDGGARETIEVLVQSDVEYLRSVLRTAAPTANIQPLPAANGAILLTGTVAHAEDVDGIVRAAIAVVGAPDRVINMMRVGGVMQVQLDVCVAKVDRTELRSFGYNILVSGPNAVFGSTVGGVAGVIPTIGSVPPSSFNSSGNGGGSQSSTGVLTGGSISASPTNANLFLALTNHGNSVFSFLQALRNENLAKILSRPSVMTLSGRPASFLSGGEQAVPVPAGLGQIGVQFEEFGTRLNVLPIVLGDGKIRLEVEPEVSNLNAAFGTVISGATVPGRDTQRVHTTVEMEDGQTFVIGGLIQRTTAVSTSKVPVLGDIPFLGVAFSFKNSTETEDELVILVTPHLVDPMDCSQAPKILPGQETRTPDDFELFLEGIMEAPRGPRVVCPDYRYVPAYKNGPTAALFPCAGNANGGAGCGTAGCGVGTHGGPVPGCGTPAIGAHDYRTTPPVEQMHRADWPAPIPSADVAPANTGKPTSLPPMTTGPGGSDGQ
jgi:pilus assembly protein CpaC